MTTKWKFLTIWPVATLLLGTWSLGHSGQSFGGTAWWVYYVIWGGFIGVLMLLIIPLLVWVFWLMDFPPFGEGHKK